MLSNWDMQDIFSVFLRIRNDVRHEQNVVVLSLLIVTLESDTELYTHNKIRKALASSGDLDKNIWEFIYHENIYVHYKITKDKNINKLLVCLCTQLQQLLIQKKYQQAYDLVDAVHCLPNIIVENEFQIPKSYWKIYVKPYRKKWDKTFLKSQEKVFKKQKG